MLSCLWFERALLSSLYMIAYQTRHTPAQASNRLQTTGPPSCPAQSNSRYSEALTATVLPLLATPHKSSTRKPCLRVLLDVSPPLGG